MDEGFSLCFGVRWGVNPSFMSVFIYLHIIQKRMRNFMSHRNIRVCLYVCHCTTPCTHYILHSGIKWTTSSIQASALNVLSQFPFILSGPYSVPSTNDWLLKRGRLSYSFPILKVSVHWVIDSADMSAYLNHCWPGVWSHLVSPKLAIVVYLFKKLKKKAQRKKKRRGKHKEDKGAGVEKHYVY